MVGPEQGPPHTPPSHLDPLADTGTEKSNKDPFRGIEQKNIPAGQTAGTLPRQHPASLGAPHSIHSALLRAPRPTRVPVGQNPIRPL